MEASIEQIKGSLVVVVVGGYLDWSSRRLIKLRLLHLHVATHATSLLACHVLLLHLHL
jgi:hypothetical protein